MFSDVLSTGLVTNVNVDTNQSDKLLRLLDTVVIKLEGGTDEDLKVLDEKPNVEYKPEPPKEPSVITATVKTVTAQSATEPKIDATETNENDEDSGEVKEVEPNATNDTNATDKATNADEKPSKKRKRTTSGSSSSSSSSTSSSGNFEIFFFKFVPARCLFRNACCLIYSIYLVKKSNYIYFELNSGSYY